MMRMCVLIFFYRIFFSLYRNPLTRHSVGRPYSSEMVALRWKFLSMVKFVAQLWRNNEIRKKLNGQNFSHIIEVAFIACLLWMVVFFTIATNLLEAHRFEESEYGDEKLN